MYNIEVTLKDNFIDNDKALLHEVGPFIIEDRHFTTVGTIYQVKTSDGNYLRKWPTTF